MNNYILTFDNNLDTEFCDLLINKFESDNNKFRGRVAGGIAKTDVKNTYDLSVSTSEKWKKEDKILSEKISNAIKDYENKIINNNNNNQLCKALSILYNYNIMDRGYKIQKYIKNEGFYKWHHDFVYSQHGVRVFTFIWYLNDVDIGGETEFIDGTKIKPKKGTLLIFPSDFTYIHRGIKPISHDKYICNGWLYINSFSPNNI